MKLMQYCLEQTEKGNDFFINYSGHVNTLSIRGTVGKWVDRGEQISGYSFKVSELTEGKVRNCIDHFDYHLVYE